MKQPLEFLDYKVSKMDFIKRILIEEGFPEVAFSKTKKSPTLVEARQWFAWLCKKKFGSSVSYNEMAKFLGGYNHATILHNKRIKDNEVQIYPSAKRVSKKLLERAEEYINFEQSLKERKKNFRSQVQNWLLSMNDKLINFSEHVEEDAVMEGWRRAKMKKDLALLEREINSIILIHEEAATGKEPT